MRRKFRSYIAVAFLAVCPVDLGVDFFLHYYYTAHRPTEAQPELGRVYKRQLKLTGTTVYLTLADTTAPGLLWMASASGVLLGILISEKRYPLGKQIELTLPAKPGWEYYLIALMSGAGYTAFLYFYGARIAAFVADHGFGTAWYF